MQSTKYGVPLKDKVFPCVFVKDVYKDVVLPQEFVQDVTKALCFRGRRLGRRRFSSGIPGRRYKSKGGE